MQTHTFTKTPTHLHIFKGSKTQRCWNQISWQKGPHSERCATGPRALRGALHGCVASFCERIPARDLERNALQRAIDAEFRGGDGRAAGLGSDERGGGRRATVGCCTLARQHGRAQFFATSPP